MTLPTADAPAQSSPDHSSRRRLVFFVTALGAFMASLDLSIVNVAFPALERTFSHDSRASLAWVITGYSIVFGSLLVIAGRTADRLGSRRVFFAGLAVFCVGSALCGVAPSVGLLVAGRLVQGFGAAALLPSSLGLLLGAFPSERRAQVVALWGGIGALAVATGPSLGAVLITGFGWRAAFYVNLPVGVVAWFVGRRVLARTAPDDSRSSPDYPGVALVSLALASLVLAISEGPSWGWSSPWIVTTFAGAVVLGVLFIRRSAHHAEPVLDLTLFEARSFTAANAATLLYAMGFFAMLLGNILFLTSVWHYTILRAGLAVTPGPLVVALVSGPAGKMAGRFGFRKVLLVGFAVFAAGLVWYATKVGIHPDYLRVWLPGTLVVGLGIGLTFPVLSAAAVSSLHHERFAVGSAVNQTARQVGGALGVALLVVILGTPNSADAALTNFHHLWLYAALMAVLSGLTSTLLRPERARLASDPVPAVVRERATARALSRGWRSQRDRRRPQLGRRKSQDGHLARSDDHSRGRGEAERVGIPRAIRDGKLPPPPIAMLMGFTMREVDPGRVMFDCIPDESAYNPIGVVHGGLVCTLADTVAACAVHTTLDVGVAYTSIDLNVSYLRPVTKETGILRATGILTKPGRRVAFSSAEIAGEDGKLVATATSSCLVMGPAAC